MGAYNLTRAMNVIGRPALVAASIGWIPVLPLCGYAQRIPARPSCAGRSFDRARRKMTNGE